MLFLRGSRDDRSYKATWLITQNFFFTMSFANTVQWSFSGKQRKLTKCISPSLVYQHSLVSLTQYTEALVFLNWVA